MSVQADGVTIVFIEIPALPGGGLVNFGLALWE